MAHLCGVAKALAVALIQVGGGREGSCSGWGECGGGGSRTETPALGQISHFTAMFTPEGAFTRVTLGRQEGGRSERPPPQRLLHGCPFPHQSLLPGVRGSSVLTALCDKLGTRLSLAFPHLRTR